MICRDGRWSRWTMANSLDVWVVLLDESEMPMKIRQKFLMAYVSRLEEGI